MRAMKRYLLLAVLAAGCGSAAADSPKGPNETGGYVCVQDAPITASPDGKVECDGEWQPSTDRETSVP